MTLSWALPELEISEPEGEPRHVRLIPIEEAVVLVGRDPQRSEIALRDRSVSALHLRLTWHEGTHWVEDLCSRNGVAVNGTKIRSPRGLSHGDRIRLGRTRMTYVSYQQCLAEHGITPRDEPSSDAPPRERELANLRRALGRLREPILSAGRAAVSRLHVLLRSLPALLLVTAVLGSLVYFGLRAFAVIAR